MQGMTDARFMTAAITGASSGIGHALALALARPGATLHLAGRNEARLKDAADAARAKGATVRETLLDVRDVVATAVWINEAGRLDLVVANAGVSGGTGGGAGMFGEPTAQARAIFDINVTGVLNTALPAIELMRGQEPGPDGMRGRVAVIASIAAFLNMPGAPAYCASKAAIQRWAEAVDLGEARRGVRVHAICPGFVRTPMTDTNPFPMPGLMTPDYAATRILKGIEAGQRRVAFPWFLYAGARAVSMIPEGLRFALLKKAPAKKADANLQ
ncbi:SDR family NAD(P)-dependent oxidoreductase [Acetobacteraceae bacterium H6797]|nr:SDR family NAD(P)-dependent oxidoreductase [Acetobacteraceae bacterium H6797]